MITVLAAIDGEGFTKLTVCNDLAASELCGEFPRRGSRALNVPALLALGSFEPSGLAVREQKLFVLDIHNEEESALLPARRR